MILRRPSSVYEEGSPQLEGVSISGCRARIYGFQVMAQALGGTVDRPGLEMARRP